MQSHELNKHHQRDWVHPCGMFKYFPARLSLLNTQFSAITLASACVITVLRRTWTRAAVTTRGN